MSTESERSREAIDVPAEVAFTVRPGRLEVKGALGRVERPFPSDLIALTANGGRVTLERRPGPERQAPGSYHEQHDGDREHTRPGRHASPTLGARMTPRPDPDPPSRRRAGSPRVRAAGWSGAQFGR